MRKTIATTFFLMSLAARAATVSPQYAAMLDCLKAIKMTPFDSSMQLRPGIQVGDTIVIAGKRGSTPGFYVYLPNQTYFYELPSQSVANVTEGEKEYDVEQGEHYVRLSIPGQGNLYLRYKYKAPTMMDSGSPEAYMEASYYPWNDLDNVGLPMNGDKRLGPENDPRVAKSVTAWSFTRLGNNLLAPNADPMAKKLFSDYLKARIHGFTDSYQSETRELKSGHKTVGFAGPGGGKTVDIQAKDYGRYGLVAPRRRDYIRILASCGDIHLPEVQEQVEKDINTLNRFSDYVIPHQPVLPGYTQWTQTVDQGAH